jgi:hypothetical protein
MLGTLFSTPRPEPSHQLPVAGSALVLLLAIPVFLLAGWSLAGWGIAAVLWVFVHGLDLFLARARKSTGTLAASGVQAFALFFKSIGLLAVLVAAIASSPHLALEAAATYALAYTFELGLSVVFYLGSAPR